MDTDNKEIRRIALNYTLKTMAFSSITAGVILGLLLAIWQIVLIRGA